MNNPLEVKANIIGENIQGILNGLSIDSDNFEELKKYLSKEVNVYPK